MNPTQTDQEAREIVDTRRGIHGIIGASVLIVLMLSGLLLAATTDPINTPMTVLWAVCLTITCVGMRIMIGKTNQTTAALRSFARYIPARQALTILKACEPAKLESSPRTVAVLFSDLQGFDKLVRELESREVGDLLNHYFMALVAVLDASGASVDKFMGDSLLAFWDSDDAAAQATKAVREVLATFDDWNAERAKRGEPELETHFGLSFGEVELGNFGSPIRMNYTIHGDVVNTAARAMNACGKHGVRVLGTAALREASADAAWRSVGALELAHRGEVELYTLS